MNCRPEITIRPLPEGYTYVSRCYGYNYEPYVVERNTPQVIDGRMQVVNEQGQHGIIDLDGREVIPCSFQQIDTHCARYAITSRPRDGRTDPELPEPYLSRDIDWAGPTYPIADTLRNCEERYYGCVDGEGGRILSCDCTEVRYAACEHQDDDRIVYAREGAMGVCDRKGNDILPCAYDWIYAYQCEEGLFFSVGRSGCEGVFDSQGGAIIPCVMEEVRLYPFPRYGTTATYKITCLEDGFWRVVDLQGKAVTGRRYEDIVDAIAEMDEAFGGIECTPCQNLSPYGSAPASELDGSIVYGNPRRNLSGYVDSLGKTVIATRYRSLNFIGKRHIVVQSARRETKRSGGCDPRYWLFDGEGRRIFSRPMKAIFPTCTGKIAAVSLKGRVAFYDEDTGEVQWASQYYDFREYPLAAPYYLVSDYLGEFFGLVDGDGALALPMGYASFCDDEYAEGPSFAVQDECGNWCIITIERDSREEGGAQQ